MPILNAAKQTDQPHRGNAHGGRAMRALLVTLLALASATETIAAQDAPTRIDAQSFITLPTDVRFPEGLAVDPVSGEIFVGTFDARNPASARNNQLLRYSVDGKLIGRHSFGATPLTGITYREGKIYILNFGTGQLQRLAARFDEATPVEILLTFPRLDPSAPPPRAIANPDGSQDVTTFGSSGIPAPNGMVFDSKGNLFVSDSFQGAVYRIEQATSCKDCTAIAISRGSLLATAGALPFGANGLALSLDEKFLYITNAGDGRLLRMQLPSGPIDVLAESLPGADGLIFHEGLLWVAANQADRVIALNEQGRIVASAGEFQGIRKDGSPQGLLFPATTAVNGKWMIVTNLSLPLSDSAGDEWEEAVRRWTLVRFPIPSISMR